MRSTRDRNCPTEFALLPECADNTRSHVLEQETVLNRVRGETRDHTCRDNRYRTSQSTQRDTRSHMLKQSRTSQSTRRDTRSHVSRQQISYFSEYAVRHEIARVRTQLVLLPEYADNTTARVKDQRCETARLCRSNTTDDAEWMRNDAALFLMG